MDSTKEPTINLTMEQAQAVFDALDIGLGAATEEAANFHEAMKGYKPDQHKRLDDDAAKVNAAVTLMGQLMESARESAEGGEAASLTTPEEDAALLWLGSVRDDFRRMADEASRLLSHHAMSIAASGEAKRLPLPSQSTLDSPSIAMPPGLTPGERRAFILGAAAGGEAGGMAEANLPELPEAVAHVHSNGEVCMDRRVEDNGVWPVELVTLKQAHDYARAYAAALPVVSASQRMDEGRINVAEVALWQYRWTNPANEPNHSPSMSAWEEVKPRNAIQTMEQRLNELRSYRYDGKPCYEVRALGVIPAGVHVAPAAVTAPQRMAEWESKAPMHPNLKGLAAALRCQRQVDEDGTEVGVSRQAADEAATIIEALDRAAVTAPTHEQQQEKKHGG